MQPRPVMLACVLRVLPAVLGRLGEQSGKPTTAAHRRGHVVGVAVVRGTEECATDEVFVQGKRFSRSPGGPTAGAGRFEPIRRRERSCHSWPKHSNVMVLALIAHCLKRGCADPNILPGRSTGFCTKCPHGAAL